MYYVKRKYLSIVQNHAIHSGYGIIWQNFVLQLVFKTQLKILYKLSKIQEYKRIFQIMTSTPQTCDLLLIELVRDEIPRKIWSKTTE